MASLMRLITFITDFGVQDWYVACMKGVILGLAPTVRLVDITHEIPPGDLPAGALALAAAYRHFPRRTIHVVVVDPGVGSARAALVVQTDDYCFVGPDNGVLSLALAGEHIQAIHRLERPQWFHQPVSATFHGRDVFAPVAAHLSRGVPAAEFGPAQRDFIRLDWPPVKIKGDILIGELVYFDRFGNGITNIPGQQLEARIPASVDIATRHGRRRAPLVPFFQAVPRGYTLAMIGSSGFLEIAVNGGSARQKLALRRGDRVRVRRSDP
jgi:S-adenosyl-L-methionine hydrolase (adenosine-forming)